MRSMYTGSSGRSRIDHRRVGLGILLCFVASSCAEKSGDRSSVCEFEPKEIMRAASSDPRLSGYGAESWAAPRTVVLWDRGSAEKFLCASTSDQFLLVKSSTEFDRSQPFVAVEKLYFDDSAAFVELGFPPSGKNADVFMRKDGGIWRVKQIHLWEN